MGIFEEKKKVFEKLVGLCDEGIKLEERKKNGEDTKEAEEELFVKITVQIIKLQE